MKTLSQLACLGVLATAMSCSTAAAPAGHEPSLADFAHGDREAVAAMLREVAGRFRSPYNVLPGSRAVTVLVACRVRFVRAGVVGVQCLSDAPDLGLAVDDSVELYHQPEWAQREFGVTAGPLSVGELRTCVVHGSGFGGSLWKRFLVFPGPAR